MGIWATLLHFHCHQTLTFRWEDTHFTLNGEPMNNSTQTLDAQADLLVEEALHELGEIPLDEPDDYTMQCDYAGCYPWLADVICAHPHDGVTLSALHGGDTEAENTVC